MRRLSRWVLLAYASLPAFADPPTKKPVTIAVLDSPLDILHPQIFPYVDIEAMNRVRVNMDGKEETLLERNEAFKKEYIAAIKRGEFREQVELISARSSRSVPGNAFGIWEDFFRQPTPTKLIELMKNPETASALGGALKYQLFPKFREATELVGRYLHGTHVAGIAVQGANPESIKLIQIPMGGPSRGSGWDLESVKNFDPNQERAELRAYFASISKGLEDAGAKVVNLSGGIDREGMLAGIEESARHWKRRPPRAKILQAANEASRIYQEEMLHFVQSNPYRVFVMAAGNEAHNLEHRLWATTSKIRAPNLLVVGAVDADGRLLAFSNHGSEYVNMAAHGTGVSAPRVGGGQMYMEGTSMASPAAAKRVAEILSENPDLKPEEVIQELKNRSKVKMDLMKSVGGGRYLPAEVVSSNAAQSNKPVTGLSVSRDEWVENALKHPEQSAGRSLLDLIQEKQRVSGEKIESGRLEISDTRGGRLQVGVRPMSTRGAVSAVECLRRGFKSALGL